ncbi:MAG: hypothetical protein R3326_08225 [Gemmatimonadota bacterium]|nr:hypothetical protein [Gemmatimonadota bacterium]
MNPRSFPVAVVAALVLAATGCEYYPAGPSAPGGRYPRVDGSWRIDARVVRSTCGFVDDEPFTVEIHQNRDLLQFVLRVTGYGEVRYDGWLERDGDFSVSQTTVFPRDAIRDESRVDGRFSLSGRSLSAREREWIVDLVSGRSCEITWRWDGDRRW